MGNAMLFDSKDQVVKDGSWLINTTVTRLGNEEWSVITEFTHDEKHSVKVGRGKTPLASDHIFALRATGERPNDVELYGAKLKWVKSDEQP